MTKDEIRATFKVRQALGLRARYHRYPDDPDAIDGPHMIQIDHAGATWFFFGWTVEEAIENVGRRLRRQKTDC